MALDSMQEIFDKIQAGRKPFWQVVRDTDVEERQVTAEASFEKMHATWRAMVESVDTYRADRRSVSGLVGGDAQRMWDYAAQQVKDTFLKVFPYILVGVGVGAVIHNWIPQAWVEGVLGSGSPLGVVLATLVGVPMYADIFGTIPVAEALLSKGAQLGTILSFMMAVTTLSLPSMIMLRKAVKPKLLALFIAICTGGIILVGYFFNAIQGFLF